jgi:precorrin-2 dehydrogenase/sirohydrochlorin ferrochelatase
VAVLTEDTLYPVCVKLKEVPCLVVGGGRVAQRKVSALLNCGAMVTLVSPQLTPTLAFQAERGEILYRQGDFDESDLDGMRLVILATDRSELHERVAAICHEKWIPVNVVDNPELSTFFVPASLQRGPITISVSTGGYSPLLSKRIRELLEREISPQLGDLAMLLGDLRHRLPQQITSQSERQRLWDSLLTPEMVALVTAGHLEQWKEQANRIRQDIMTTKPDKIK